MPRRLKRLKMNVKTTTLHSLPSQGKGRKEKGRVKEIERQRLT